MRSPPKICNIFLCLIILYNISIRLSRSILNYSKKVYYFVFREAVVLHKRAFFAPLSLLLGFCIIVFSSCGRSDTDIYDAIYELCEAGGNALCGDAVFYADSRGASENEELRVRSDEDFGFLYDGVFKAPSCFDRIDGYVLRIPLDDSGFEIHIIKCVNLSDCDEVEAMLLRRANKMRNAEILEYAPKGYGECLKNAEVYKKGRYVFLLSTYDNEAVYKQIKKMF